MGLQPQLGLRTQRGPGLILVIVLVLLFAGYLPRGF